MNRYFFLIFLFLFSCSSGFYSCYDGPSCKQMVDRLMKQPGRIRDLLEDTLITTKSFRFNMGSEADRFINVVNKDFRHRYITVYDTTFLFGDGKKIETFEDGYGIKIKNIEGNSELIYYFRLRNGCYKLNSILFGENHMDY